jgi:hypothetical protein
MSAQVARLNEEHITYLLMVLRNSNRPLTTADLAAMLRDRIGATG